MRVAVSGFNCKLLPVTRKYKIKVTSCRLPVAGPQIYSCSLKCSALRAWHARTGNRHHVTGTINL
ncbi:hypothetical protein A4R26_13255 [Niastella populi]|uniref:Uncharacterized protein n=1 Tax=Niastella populi TaxID=550983 RepID=A0A1V9G7Y9_9BACT|nr:hypothetical protein A4R26_13255 [Niastella populi]